VPLAIWYLQRGIEPEQLQSELLSTLSQPAVFMGVALLGQLPMGGAALIAAWLSPVPLRRRLGFVQSAWSGRETAIVLLGTLVPFAVGISSAYALSEVIPPDPGVKKMYASLTVAWAGPFVLFIAVAPAFNEEMLFRGYVQRRLLERFNPWTALLVTATIFGLFHVMPHAIVAAFPIGVWLGLMAWKSGSLWPGIACHALVNGLWNVRAVLVKFEILPQRPPLALLVILGIIGVMALAASLRIMFGRRLGASRGSRLLEHAVT
jgi:membrane protease YdiL (CAAX protease family)